MIQGPVRPDAHGVLYVMAALPEYGPALRARITPLITGIGPIEAAINLTVCLSRLDVLPRLIVSLGSAGSARLAQLEVCQVGAVAWRDMDASPLGFARGCTPLLDLPRVIDLPHRIPDLPVASLSTGADIVSGAGYGAIAEDMVDMETFAHLRAAMLFDVPLIGLRGVSDGAEDLRGLTDWTQSLGIIDTRLADAVDRLRAAMDAGDPGLALPV